jgi:hypothetical protein
MDGPNIQQRLFNLYSDPAAYKNSVRHGKIFSLRIPSGIAISTQAAFSPRTARMTILSSVVRST